MRPNGVAAGTDLFKDFTGVESGRSRMRSCWVRDGEVDVTPEEAHDAVGDLSPEQIEGRLRFRLGLHLLATQQGGRGRKSRKRLAPHHFVIRRRHAWSGSIRSVSSSSSLERVAGAGMPFNGFSRPRK